VQTKTRHTTPLWLTAAVALVVVIGAILTGSSSRGGSALASNPNLDPGTPIDRSAPDFTLTDEFGRQVSLRQFRGKVVLLAFNDSQCTTVCPLTTTAMVDAQRFLGAAGSRVQLLGMDANPQATAVSDVRAYSQLHGMVHRWRFLTGSLPQLKHLWKAYGIDAEILRGQIDHTPALYAIDPAGRLRRVYLTQMSYASVPQLGLLLAHEASSLLPGHPAVRSTLSYSAVPPISPAAQVSLPTTGGGTVRLGPHGTPRLALFFATWDSETVPDLGRRLEALNGYRTTPLTVVDEGSVEPSPGAASRFLRGQALTYPVAIDSSGRVADGYQVQDQPWFVLTSSSGRILWYYDVATQGWPSNGALVADVRAALARGSASAPPSAQAAVRALAGSPGPLSALHAQAGRLLGPESALASRLRALHGYPVVINAWASWCAPCKAEFSLFAAASARYGRRVAFVGADTDDSPADAQAFLSGHPVSYPSYQSTIGQLASVAAIQGLPTTIFLDRAGKVAYVHTGQYEAVGALAQDIEAYAR
jgi:cytochrome oxidase Cu insertion factor (SCO1/SenC/PrrC family)/thiol-disulfide isomerase/thioredoxin